MDFNEDTSRVVAWVIGALTTIGISYQTLKKYGLIPKWFKSKHEVKKDELDIDSKQLEFFRQQTNYYTESLNMLVEEANKAKQRFEEKIQEYSDLIVEKDKLLVDLKVGIERERKLLRAYKSYISYLESRLVDHDVEFEKREI